MRALDHAHMKGDLDPFVVITARAVEFMQDRYLLMIDQVSEAEPHAETPQG